MKTSFSSIARGRFLPTIPSCAERRKTPMSISRARETVNPFYAACPAIVQQAMDKFAKLTGRQYHLFEYHGAPDAERVIVLMGSGCEAVHETVDYLNARGEKLGVLKVRLYRPFDARVSSRRFPRTVKSLAVLDRTKEPGAGGDPLYSIASMRCTKWAGRDIQVVGGRYGLVLEGIHAGDDQGDFRKPRPARAQESFHHRHQ